MLSGSVPSTLLSALPLILFTNELHVVASTSVHPGQHPPSSIKVTKYYLKSDVEGIKKENVRIKELGNAAAEEWVKGLSDRGKAKRLDIARWERWEASGGLQRILRDELDIIPTVFPTTQPTSLPPRPATFHGYSGFGQPPHSGGAYAPPQIIGQPGALPLKFGEWHHLILIVNFRAQLSDLEYSTRIATTTGLTTTLWCSCPSGNTEGATYERGSRKTEIGKENRD